MSGRSEVRDAAMRAALVAPAPRAPPPVPISRRPCARCGAPGTMPTGLLAEWVCYACYRASTPHARGFRARTIGDVTLTDPAWAERVGITYGAWLGRVKRLGPERAATEQADARRCRVRVDCGWCGAAASVYVRDAHDGEQTPACDACAALGAAS